MYRRLKCLPGSIPGNQPYPHTFTVCTPVFQSALSTSQVLSICVLYRCYTSAVHVFLPKSCVAVFLFFLWVFVLLCGEVTESYTIYRMCLCVYVWMHGFVLVCVDLVACCTSLCFFLKRYAGVFEARGSSCCVPSCFPASVSTWPRAGCSLETPPQPENQPRCPAPSGRFASSGCF